MERGKNVCAFLDLRSQGFKVTDAVHAKGSFIYLQMWALGRAGYAKTLAEDGYDVVSASDLPISSEKDVPRPLSKEEIKEYVQIYALAAENSIKAGFDGVEVHRFVKFSLSGDLSGLNDHQREWLLAGSVPPRCQQ